jgi:hypothetical protein
MVFKSKKAGLIGVTVAAMLSVAAPAHAVNLLFSFDNTVGNVNGTVSGELFGLTDNATSSATAVELLSYPDVGLPTPPVIGFPPFSQNSLTLVNGDVTGGVFQWINAGVFLDINVSSAVNGVNELFNTNNGEFVRNLDGLSGVSFSVATPEPSTWALMLVGFVGLAVARYRWIKAGGAIRAG